MGENKLNFNCARTGIDSYTLRYLARLIGIVLCLGVDSCVCVWGGGEKG